MNYFYYYYYWYSKLLTALTVFKILCLVVAIGLLCSEKTNYKILGALFLIIYLLLLILYFMIRFKANI